MSAASDAAVARPPSRTPRPLAPRLLLAAYVVGFAVLAVNPYDRSVWAAVSLVSFIRNCQKNLKKIKTSNVGQRE